VLPQQPFLNQSGIQNELPEPLAVQTNLISDPPNISQVLQGGSQPSPVDIPGLANSQEFPILQNQNLVPPNPRPEFGFLRNINLDILDQNQQIG
jgi:hypothetical protein